MPFIVGSHREQERRVKTYKRKARSEKNHTAIRKDTDRAEKVQTAEHTPGDEAPQPQDSGR